MTPIETDRYLLLIRHSAVSIERDLPASKWRLSAAGRERCRQFAEQLEPYRPVIFISSGEPKAVETAQILAQSCAAPVKLAADLHEHDRQGAPYFDSQDDFRASVAHFFAAPEEVVFGRETAAAASQRFNSAVEKSLNDHLIENFAIVTHGTVLSLFVSRHNPTIDPLNFWDQLRMPCAALLRLPDLAFLELLLPAIRRP